MPIRRGVSERLYSVSAVLWRNVFLPESISRRRGGVYRWVSKSVSVYVDARDFQATAEKGLEKENEEELLRACGLYQGNFWHSWPEKVGYNCKCPLPGTLFPLPAQPQPSDAGKQRVPVPF